MRLYWQDAYQQRFSARVLRSFEMGGRPSVVLDQTLFYPTAGGQLHDTGRLADARVLEVGESEKAYGEVVHTLDRPLVVGQVVNGQLDWPRRYRHMQRHTAQHLVSQAFVRAANWTTVSVSLRNPVLTIDFSAELDSSVAKEAEALAAWAVYASLPIRSYWIDHNDVTEHGLRRPPKVSGPIRLVEIADWDKVACGGTHLRSTAEAGPIKFLKLERTRRGYTRLHLTAGWEALEDYTAKHDLLKHLGEHFSTHPLRIGQPITKLEQTLFAVQGRLREVVGELAEHRVRELLAEHPSGTIAAEVHPDLLDEVGTRLSEWPGTLALLVTSGRTQARVLLVKHQSRPEDLRALWDELLVPLGAKGGGRDIFQGALPPARLLVALEHFQQRF